MQKIQYCPSCRGMTLKEVEGGFFCTNCEKMVIRTATADRTDLGTIRKTHQIEGMKKSFYKVKNRGVRTTKTKPKRKSITYSNTDFGRAFRYCIGCIDRHCNRYSKEYVLEDAKEASQEALTTWYEKRESIPVIKDLQLKDKYFLSNMAVNAYKRERRKSIFYRPESQILSLDPTPEEKEFSRLPGKQGFSGNLPINGLREGMDIESTTSRQDLEGIETLEYLRNSLSDRQFAAGRLSLAGYTQQEISNKFGISRSTARREILQYAKTLRDYLQE